MMNTNTINKKFNRKTLQNSVIVCILVLFIAVLSVFSKEFLTYNNISNVLQQTATVTITGAAATLLMISGNIDLSPGSVVALSGVAFAKFVQMGIPFFAAIMLASMVGMAIGFINGVLVIDFKIPPVIATLGSMYVARGLAFILCDGKTVNSGLPSNFTALGRGMLGVLSVPIMLFIIVLIVFCFIEKKTILGKYAFAIGGNSTAAKLSGINVNGLTRLLFSLTGLLAGFSGCMMASRLGVGSPNVGIGFEFDVVVAVVLGGTSLSGGEGSVIGMFIGALIVGFLGNGLNLLGVQSFYQEVFKGIVLVLAVVLDRYLKRRLA